MADIFISYKKEDENWAAVLANELDNLDWSIWWDPRLIAGANFKKVIDEKLEKTKCVIVLWSKKSIESDWVKYEARKGMERNILVPAFIEKVEPPEEFSELQSVNLIGWNKDSSSARFKWLVESICEYLGPPPANVDFLSQEVAEITSPNIDSDKAKSLTQREVEILVELSNGLSRQKIGQHLFIETSTVASHLNRVYKKLGVSTAPGAVGKAFRENIIS